MLILRIAIKYRSLRRVYRRASKIESIFLFLSLFKFHYFTLHLRPLLRDLRHRPSLSPAVPPTPNTHVSHCEARCPVLHFGPQCIIRSTTVYASKLQEYKDANQIRNSRRIAKTQPKLSHRSKECNLIRRNDVGKNHRRQGGCAQDTPVFTNIEREAPGCCALDTRHFLA